MANGIITRLCNLFNIPLRIRSSDDGKAIFFADQQDQNMCEEKEYYNMGALGPYTADRQRKFKLQYGDWRIFEVRDKDQFFFDNVDVFPDDDNKQRLGLKSNRWKELNAVAIGADAVNLYALEKPPAGTPTVELVVDPVTGRIYRKN
jgi:hypothetical protein